MFFQYASDLHLEFSKNKKILNRKPLIAAADVLILAGDVMPFIMIDDHNDFWNYISDNFKQTYWLPGNHEYYGFDAATKHGTIHENIRTNISLINNDSVIIENVHFLPYGLILVH
jgi:predicted phosphohydrolase